MPKWSVAEWLYTGFHKAENSADFPFELQWQFLEGPGCLFLRFWGFRTPNIWCSQSAWTARSDFRGVWRSRRGHLAVGSEAYYIVQKQKPLLVKGIITWLLRMLQGELENKWKQESHSCTTKKELFPPALEATTDRLCLWHSLRAGCSRLFGRDASAADTRGACSFWEILQLGASNDDHTFHEYLWWSQLGKCSSSAHEDVTRVGVMFPLFCRIHPVCRPQCLSLRKKQLRWEAESSQHRRQTLAAFCCCRKFTPPSTNYTNW